MMEHFPTSNLKWTLVVVVIALTMTNRSDACIPTKTPSPGIPAIPACKKCADDLVTEDLSQDKFDTISTDSTGACAVRTFVCGSIFVQYNGVNSYTTVTNGKLRFALTCSADGTAWMLDDIVVAGKVACKSRL